MKSEIPLEFVPDGSVPKVQIVENDDMYDPEIFQNEEILKSRLKADFHLSFRLPPRQDFR